jgi:Polyketide cyclase / dehydrase and lipid transport
MRKILSWAAILVVVAIAGILAYAATLPTSFRVARSATMTAAPDAIFPHINSLRGFKAWEPFSRKDPAIKIAYSGPESGKGAAYTWDGNGDVGQGRVEIADTAPPSRVTMKLDMVKPMEAHNTVVFTLEPKGDATTVTWAMTGDRPYIGKVLDAVLNMDRMVGGEFEKGLAELKSIVEKK